MGMGPYRRKKPIDSMAETGDMGDLGATAMPAGDEGDLDPLAAMTPPMGDEAGLQAMLDPMGGGGAVTDSPMLGEELSAGITNPGDAALDLGGEGMPMEEGMGMEQDPGLGLEEDPAELEAAMMEESMGDPMTPPDEQALIQQQLQLAARRRLAGL
jgi:hypothetical protein